MAEQDTLTRIVLSFISLAAFSSTLFPILYLFSPWYSTVFGRVIMLKAVTIALIVDLTFVFQIWPINNVIVITVINCIAFGLVAISTSLMVWLLWRSNYSEEKEKL